MQIRLIAVFVAQASLLLQIPSHAIGQVPPEDCAIFDQHFSEPPPTNLGNGMVTTQSYPLAFSSGSFRFESREVTECASGDQLDIFFVNDPAPGEAGGFYAGQLAVEFEAQITSNVFGTLSDIKREAERLGLPVIESNKTREVCGCAAFYPSLRGSKEAARVPMAEMRARAEEPEPDYTNHLWPVMEGWQPLDLKRRYALDETNLEQLSLLAWSNDLRAEESPYAVENLDCGTLLGNGDFQSVD